MAKLIEFKNDNGDKLRGIVEGVDSKEAIVFVHGFERTTIETKFKNFIDILKDKYLTFRFDFTGCGLSDGDFANTTVKSMTQDLKVTICEIQSIYPQITKINIVSHSLGCVASLIYAKQNINQIKKIIALAPALNQKELQRFWFVNETMRKTNPETQVSWQNYKEFLDEMDFESYCQLGKTTKSHYINPEYCLEVLETDFQILLTEDVASKMLIIHGSIDDKVPFESNNQLPPEIKILKTEGGDHDLEKPVIVKQYLDNAIKFLEE